jgi:hypothetical protein
VEGTVGMVQLPGEPLLSRQVEQLSEREVAEAPAASGVRPVSGLPQIGVAGGTLHPGDGAGDITAAVAVDEK